MSRTFDRYVRFTSLDEDGLYLVRQPETRIRPTCDIILVHGLNGGPAKTWRHAESQKIWFEEYLPEDIIDEERGLNARIWTYGYNANTAFRAAAGSHAFDFAYQLLDRVSNIRQGFEHLKLIWICHSLGGIVVKTALIEARLNPDYTPILQSTVGILFMGTPHQGSRVANIADIAVSIARIMLPGILFMANQRLIRSLKENCDELFETAGRFATICTSIKVYNIHEMQAIGGRLIVERRSAVMNLQGETRIPMQANHVTLCKYKDKSDNNYIVVRDTVRNVLRLTCSPQALRDVHTWSDDLEPTQSHHAPPVPNSQRSRDRSGTPIQPDQTHAPETSSSRTNEASYSQNSAQELENSVNTAQSSRSTPYSFVRPGNSAQSLSARLSELRPFTNDHTRPNGTPSPPDNAFNRSRRVYNSTPTYEISENPIESGTLESSWNCDVCGNVIPLSRARVHCLQCNDYDLCETCFQTGKFSKNHAITHRVRTIIKSYRFQQEAQDLVPPGVLVHPQTSPGKSQPNWSIEKDIRWHHLSDNGHARFLASTIEPGHYLVTFCLGVRFSPKVTRAHIEEVAADGFGNIRVAVGIVTTKRRFFKERFLENDALASRLFSGAVQDDFQIMHSQSQWLKLSDTLHVESRSDGNLELGLLLQWSKVRSFSNSAEPLVKLSLLEVRLEDLLEFDSPHSSNGPPTPEESSATSRQPNPPPTNGIPEPSDSDIYQAIMDAARERKTQEDINDFSAVFRELIQRRQREQMRAQEAAEARSVLQRISAIQRARDQRQSVETLAQLGLLQAYLNSALND